MSRFTRRPGRRRVSEPVSIHREFPLPFSFQKRPSRKRSTSTSEERPDRKPRFSPGPHSLESRPPLARGTGEGKLTRRARRFRRLKGRRFSDRFEKGRTGNLSPARGLKASLEKEHGETLLTRTFAVRRPATTSREESRRTRWPAFTNHSVSAR